MSSMFNNLKSLNSLHLNDLFITKNVVDVSYMFQNCQELTSLEISKFDTSKVTDMNSIFKGCKNIKELDLKGFTTSFVTNFSCMFSEMENLSSLDISYLLNLSLIRIDLFFQEL